MAHASWLVLSALLALAAMPGEAAACSCVPFRPCSALWSADGTPADVFEATVTSIQELRVTGRDAGRDSSLVGTNRIAVSLSDVRGRLGRTTSLVYTDRSSCGVTFVVGRRYLIHTNVSRGAAVGQCSMTAPLAQAGELLAFLEQRRPTQNPIVSGLVTLDIESSAPGEWSRPLRGIRVSVNGPVSRSVVSDAKGAFTFSTLPRGEYTLVAEEDPRNGIVPKDSMPFTVSDERACLDFSLSMGLTSLIEGRVLDRDGTPVPGMTVDLFHVDFNDPSLAERGAMAPISSSRSKTSAAGRFAFRGVPPGRYRIGVNLQADPGPMGATPLTGTDGRPAIVALGVGEHRAVGVIRLPHRRVRLVGTVRQLDGRPAAGVEVQAEALVGARQFLAERLSTRSDASGRFDFPLAEGQRYRVRADAANDVRGVLEVAAGAGPVEVVLRPRR